MLIVTCACPIRDQIDRPPAGPPVLVAIFGADEGSKVNINLFGAEYSCVATYIHKYSDFLVAMISVVIARDMQ